MKAMFLSELNATPIDDKIDRINEDFQYWSEILNDKIIVPAGFTTDYASIPRWIPLVYAILGGSAKVPAVIHDFLYQTHKVNRKMADDILFEAMSIWKMDQWKKYPIYAGVRVGGWKAWNDYTGRALCLGNQCYLPK